MSFARRDILKTASALALGMALPGRAALGQGGGDALAQKALSAGERQVVIGGSTGAYAELVSKHFLMPFTEATGIKVQVDGGSYGEKLAKLRAMTAVNRVEWDIITLSVDMLTPDVSTMLRDVGGCGSLPNVAANAIPGACLRHGVMFDIGGGVLAFNAETFPGGKPQPVGWADFWDVRRFPGPRALPNIGTPAWPLMAALLADGVPAAKLFPLDLDRAFKKMDEIKPHIAVWWRSGDQSQQIFRSREVVMAMMFSGRALRLKSEGQPISVVWNGAPLDASFWGVTRAAPHPNAALALLDFIYTRPEAHAAFAAASFGATAHGNANALMEPAARALQPVHPNNWSKIVPVDRGWLAANQETVSRRWTSWIAS